MELRREKGKGNVPGAGKLKEGKGTGECRVLSIEGFKGSEFINSDENNIEYLPKKKLSR